jgi:EmrB/QacA subfamily drug resistance transporter
MRDLGRPVLLAAAVVVCGAVMTILDTTIVNVAIDRLGVVFDTPLATIQWVSTAYLLALAAVIPLTGWMVDRFGTRRVFIGAVSLFLAGSALCGLAWSAGALIGFRVLQGLGGGMVMPCGMTILARAAGQERMGRVMALVGVPMLLAPALGPMIGGALVDGASWRLIFFLNLPVGLFALAVAARVLPRAAPVRARIDLLGALLLSPGLAALTGALTTGSLLLLGAGVILVAAFVAHALRARDPLIDVRIFRVIAAPASTTLIFGAAFFGSLFLLALYYQLARDESAFATGLLLVPQGVGAMLTMPVAGKLTDRRGAGPLVLGGIVLVVLGTVPFATGAPGWVLALGLFARGAGMGATLMPAMAAAYQALPEAQVARAASALEIVQRAGASLGIALLAVLLQRRVGAGSLSDLDHIPGSAASWTFVWALVLTALALIPALFLPPRRQWTFVPFSFLTRPR